MENLMKEILQRAKKKNVSCNLNERILEMVDEMAKILGASRSETLDVLIFSGLWAHTTFSIKTWESEKKKKEYEGKRERIEEVIRKIREFKKKWEISDSPYTS